MMARMHDSRTEVIDAGEQRSEQQRQLYHHEMQYSLPVMTSAVASEPKIQGAPVVPERHMMSSYPQQGVAPVVTTTSNSAYQQSSYPQYGFTSSTTGHYVTTASPSVARATSQQYAYPPSGQIMETSSSTFYSAPRIVTGEERVIGWNTHVQEERVISERIVEHEIKVPKRVVREEVIEKVIVIPETITREEVIEEVQKVKETIIEVAKPIIQEKIVEVPQIEYVEKIVEKVEKVVQEKVVEVPTIKYEERIIEVPKIVLQERVVQVPNIEYREVITEKIVEVPEIRQQVHYKEVPVPQYVDKPVPEYVTVEEPVDVERNIPVPVEAVTTFEYQLAQFRPRVNKVTYPLYVPRFVEVPVSAELFDQSTIANLQASAAKLQVLSSPQAVGLCEVEELASALRAPASAVAAASSVDLQTALTEAWKSGRIAMRGPMQSSSAFQTAEPVIGSTVTIRN